MRGLKWGGVSVAESDHGDPPAEVEVAAAVLAASQAPSPRRTPPGPAVGRQEPRGAECSGHASPAVRPISTATPPRAARAAARVRHDSAGELSRVDEALCLVRDDCVRDLALDDHTGHVGEEEEALGAEPDRESGRGLVGVHVHRPVRERGDDGSRLPVSASKKDRPGRRRDGPPDVAELGDLDRREHAVRQWQRMGPDGGADPA